MTADAVIRPAVPDDMTSVAAIYAHYVEQTVVTFDERAPDVDEWRRRLEATEVAGWPFLVTQLGGDVVGYAFVTAYHSRSDYRFTVENSIYLHPRYTGRRLGRPLLLELLSAAAARGAREVVAAIADTGAPASIELHSAAGFRSVGTLTGVGFKHGRRVDVHYMQRSLS